MSEKNMKTALSPLIDRKIGIFLEHNQFVEGVLSAIKQDHLVVHIDGETCYLTLAHIQAFTGIANHTQTTQKETVHLNSNDLIGVLTNLQNNWVEINRFSNQVFCGILSSIQKDYIVVTNDQQIHYIGTSHIANIHPRVIDDESNLTITKMTDLSDEINKEKEREESLFRLVSLIKQRISNFTEDIQTYLPKEQGPIRKNENRKLLTPWSEMNYDQNAIAIPKTDRKKKPPIPMLPVEKNESFIDEKPPIATPKQFEEQPVEDFINPKERKAMVEKQYYALMRHAELNHEQETEDPQKFRIQERKKDDKTVVEKQYYSLMRHAAKMYRQLSE